MDKRFLPALLVSLAFVMAYQAFFMPPVVPPPADATPAVSDGFAGNGGASGSPAVSPGNPAAPAAGTPATGAPANRTTPPVGAAGAALADVHPEVSVVLDTEDHLTRWESRGAGLRELSLREPWITPEGDPLPLVARLDGLTDSLLLREVTGAYGLDQRHWQVQERSGELRFTLDTPDGLRFERVVRKDPRSHVLALSISVTNTGAQVHPGVSLVLQGARGLVDEEVGSKWYGEPQAVVVLQEPNQETEILSWKAASVDNAEGRRVGENEALLGAGTMTNYFCATLVPEGETDVRQVAPLVLLDQLKFERHDSEGSVPRAAAIDASLKVNELQPGEAQHYDFSFYAGPKSKDVAAAEGFAFLVPMIEVTYGRMSWINRALLTVLRFLHGISGNWGVAVILLTLLVKGMLFPLNRRQQTSMMRYSSVMQKLKPQLDELKKKLKGNTKAYNQAQMKLLQEHGARPPLGGCLIMFLQFPIWISLFQILGTSIELRQSSFVGWIDDLSRPDAMPLGIGGFETVNVLPILMALATIVQMRTQAKPADAQQASTQKIMGTIMPLFMLWFLYSYPSGLSLYIFTSSLMGIFEMRVIRKVWPIDDGSKAPAVQVAKPAKAGKGT